jgi:hypothetical protein
LVPGFCFFAVILAVWLCLAPGMTGGFLFDDLPNLRDLGAYGGVTDWGTFKAYVMGGVSGPSGRPLSLMTFLLDDNTWPSNPFSFKRTNVLLHLLNFCALTWLCLQLLRFYNFDEKRAQRLAVFSAAAWALHPFLVSTTLYVVQRMAQLSTLFVFVGLVGFLVGRRLFDSSPRQGMCWMAGGVMFGTLLAVLCKENGILLPLLALVIELCRPVQRKPLPKWFVSVLLWLPSIALGIFLLRYLDFSPSPWPNRSFNQIERLLSESRIIFLYLNSLFMPRIEDMGLYQDGFLISSGVFAPRSTLYSLVGIFTLIIGAWLVRRSLPLLALAILFFFASHLLESSLLGLELYFEHRNYLAAAFLFLPCMAAFDALQGRVSAAVAYSVPMLLLLLLAGLTYQRAMLWGNPDKLESYWAVAAKNSPRAQSSLASQLWRQGRFEDALQQINDAALNLNGSSLISVNRLLIYVRLHRATPQIFSETANRLVNQAFDAQAVTALRHLTDEVQSHDMPVEYRVETFKLIEYLEQYASYNRFPLFVRLTPYLKAQLMLAQKKVNDAYVYYIQAMGLYGNIDPAMQMVAEMGNAGYPEMALKMLDKAEDIYRIQDEKTLKFDRVIYEREINNIRVTLQDDITKHHE